LFKTVFLTNFFNPICFVFFNTNSFWWDFYSFTIKIEKGKSQIFCNFCIFCNLSFFYICDILHLFYVFDILVLFRIFHFCIFFFDIYVHFQSTFFAIFGFIIFSNVIGNFRFFLHSTNFLWFRLVKKAHVFGNFLYVFILTPFFRRLQSSIQNQTAYMIFLSGYLHIVWKPRNVKIC